MTDKVSASDFHDLDNYESFDEYLAAIRQRSFMPQIEQRVAVWPPGMSFKGTGTVVAITTKNPGTPLNPMYFVEYDHGGGTWISANSLYPEE